MNNFYLKNIAAADLDACEKAGSFLQSALWGRFKSRFGWKAHAFEVEWNCGIMPLMALSRRLAPGVTMAYIPWGPELPAAFPDDPKQRACAAAQLAHALQPFLPGAAFARFDFPWFLPNEGGQPSSFQASMPAPFKRAAADIQPPDTVIIDLRPPAEEIRAAMKAKCRYNIGLAEKRNVEVINSGTGGMEIFYRLLAETARRDGIAVHGIEYYQTLFEECKSGDGDLHLYTAWHDGDALAAIIVLFRGRQAVYLYGASSNIKRNLMAPYLLQWKAIQDAKSKGCADYDLFGIPPDENPHHPMAGLYRFKTGFGGTILHRPGSWDYPYRKMRYFLFSFAERRRKKAMNRNKKQKIGK
ncbi:MAG: peptidoglycan bridge formation glycyltransferase FemA/FemB family protein [Treponema sp.]|nr:peptidoglycan bridge formation glycyltransferase FemA/FemB family protein [Treponema sp.]